MKKVMRTLPFSPLYLLAAATVYPLFFMIFAAFKSTDEYLYNKFMPPKRWTLENLEYAWTSAKIGKYALNSIFVTGGGLFLGLLLAAMAGFSFAKLRYPGRIKLLYATLAFSIIPFAVLMGPFFKLIVDLNMNNTYWGLIVIYAAFSTPFAAYLCYSYYRSIPNEIMESARIDGAGIHGIFSRIMLPIGQPVLVTLGVLNFMSLWNDLLTSLLVMQSDGKRTLMVGIANLKGQFGVQFPVMAAALLIATVPIFVVFIVFSDKVARGITLGAVK